MDFDSLLLLPRFEAAAGKAVDSAADSPSDSPPGVAGLCDRLMVDLALTPFSWRRLDVAAVGGGGGGSGGGVPGGQGVVPPGLSP